VAHFAEIDANNVVLRVIVIDNKDTSDANGVEKEHIGAAFCERLFGGTWKQTSYNGNIRKHYAGIGYAYNSVRDAFIPPQPYPSWILDEDANWQPPIAMPTDGQKYSWNETTQSWDVIAALTTSQISAL
jgi:hypothetical protein